MMMPTTPKEVQTLFFEEHFAHFGVGGVYVARNDDVGYQGPR
jgi:hypothetical protein